MITTRLRVLVLAACVAAGVELNAAAADANATLYEFAIPPEPLSQALREYCQITQRQILYTEEMTQGHMAPALKGRFGAGDAIAALLSGSGLSVQTTPAGVLVLQWEARPASAGGQSSANPAPADDQIQQVVVSANKRVQRLQDVPASITAETGATLEHRGATQLADIIQTTAGLTNAGAGGGNSTDLTIRGVTTGGLGLKQSTVALLFDDIPVDPSFFSQSATNLRTVDIERVEVLRGPQGTLFGSGSLSGAVRFITNKPDMRYFSASGEVTEASTAGGAATTSGNVVVNAPIVPGKLAVRAVGYDYDEGGWVDNIRTGRSNVNGNQTKGGRLEIEGRPSAQLTLTATGAYEDSHDLGGGESLYTQPAGYGADREVTNLRLSTNLDVVSKILNVGARYDLPAVSLFSSSTYIRREAVQLDDGGFYNDALALVLGVPSLAGQSAPAVTANDQDIFTQEIRASSRGAGPLKWTIGAFYLDASIKGGQLISSPAFQAVTGTSTLGNLQSTGDQIETSVFGEATYTLADKWDLTAGMRASRTVLKSDSTAAGVLLTGNPDPSDVVPGLTHQRDTDVDPRFSLAYRSSPDLTLYVTAARGHRVGGPNLTASLGGDGIPKSYGGDSLWNYEAGAKSRLFDGHLQLSGDLYYIDWSHIQAALVENNINYTGNAGSAAIYGLELEALVKPSPWLDLGGSISLSHGKLTQDDANVTRVTGAVGVRSGEQLPASPTTKVSAFSQFNFNLFDRTAYLRIADNYIGSEYTDFGHLGTRFGDFDTVDLRAGVFLDAFELVFFINNLTNSHGARGASDQTTVGPVVADPQLAYRVRPITAGVTLRADF